MYSVKQMSRLIAAIFFFSCFFASLSTAQTIKAGAFNFPPFYVVDGKNFSGTLYDILDKTLKKSGLDYTIEGLPAKRLYNQLATGASHVFMGIKGVPTYKDHVLTGENSIVEIKLNIYGLPETEMPENINGLVGEKVLTISGYGYGGYRAKFLTNPDNKIEIIESLKHDSLFKMLKAKRSGVKYLLDYEGPANEALKTVQIPGIQSIPVFNLKVYLIVSKKTPNAPEVLKKLETAYNELKAAGKI